jgi:hypothetical protein
MHWRWAGLIGIPLWLGCSPSPCSRVCNKLNSCPGVLAVSESQCENDCNNPPNGGQTCSNEDAIATCIEQASCQELSQEDSRLQCPSCD